jgi:nicotinamidase-related amidase
MPEVSRFDAPPGDYVAVFAPRVDLDPAVTALVVVDLQYGLASRAAGLGRLLVGAAEYRFSRIEETVVPNVARLLAAFRDGDLRRVFLAVGAAMPDYSDLPPHLRALCRATNTRVGEREFDILDEVAPRPDEPVVHKLTLSGFASTPLERILRTWDVETLVFAGVTTNMCVEHNVRDAADRGFGCVLVEDACATDSPQMHEASLRTVARLYGRVARTEQVIAELGAGVGRA